MIKTTKKYKRITKQLRAQEGDVIGFRMSNGKILIGQIIQDLGNDVHYGIVFFSKQFTTIPNISEIKIDKLTVFMKGVIISPQIAVYSVNKMRPWFFLGNLPNVNHCCEFNKKISYSAESFRNSAEVYFSISNLPSEAKKRIKKSDLIIT